MKRTFITTPKSLVNGFTLVELLVVIFIFLIVILMASSAIASGFLTGRNTSTGSEEMNRGLSLVMDVIGQKMANANDKANAAGSPIYGFRYDDVTKNLTIVSTVAGGAMECTSFALLSDSIVKVGKIYMNQEDCSTGSFKFKAAVPATWEQITPNGVSITAFDLTQKEYSKSDKTAPYLVVKITGEDVSTGTNTGLFTTLESAYSIPAYTYNKW